jgi:hypothetical protein
MGGYNFHLRKLKYSIVLPAVQLPLAVVLSEIGRRTDVHRIDIFDWPPSALICYGINAPAIFFRLAVFPFTRTEHFWSLPSLSGYGSEELAFFVGVCVVWFLVGRKIDMRRNSESPSEGRNSVREIMLHGGLVVLGVGFFLAGFSRLRILFKFGPHWAILLESVLCQKRCTRCNPPKWTRQLTAWLESRRSAVQHRIAAAKSEVPNRKDECR